MTIRPNRAAIALNTFIAPAIVTRAARGRFYVSPFKLAMLAALALGACLGAAAPYALHTAPAGATYQAAALATIEGETYADIIDSGLTLDDCRTYAAIFDNVACELETASRSIR